jgi:Sad1 / UNC-like C-terminal
VTIEHADPRLLPLKSTSSAPRLVTVRTTAGKVLGKFEFDPKSRLETFEVASERLDRVVIGIESNWGAAWTCLYRVRVHGDE